MFYIPHQSFLDDKKIKRLEKEFEKIKYKLDNPSGKKLNVNYGKKKKKKLLYYINNGVKIIPDVVTIVNNLKFIDCELLSL